MITDDDLRAITKLRASKGIDLGLPWVCFLLSYTNVGTFADWERQRWEEAARACECEVQTLLAMPELFRSEFEAACCQHVRDAISS